MADKHMKWFSASLEKYKLKALNVPSIGEDLEQWKLSSTASRNVKWSDHSGKRLAVSYKIIMYLPNDPGNPFLDVFPRGKEIHVHA